MEASRSFKLIISILLISESLQDGIIVSQSSTYLVRVQTQGRSLSSESTCIKEKGLIFHHLTLADTRKFKEYSFKECLEFCLQDDNAEKTHMMIAYSSGIFSNKFNCLCAEQQALTSAVQVASGNCDAICPHSTFKCGNANDDFLSVYCLYKSCQNDSQEPICKKRMPHDFHGCLDGSNIQWKYAHNVRNFTAQANDHSACIWECYDNHPFALYSLTRKVNGILTCSCGYPEAFDPGRMIVPELCSIDLPEVDLYFVNCVEDLKPEGGEIETIDYENQCKDVLPIGCLYQELVKADRFQGVTLKLQDTEKIHPFWCHKLCLSLPQSFLHVGIRFDPNSNSLECSCLQKGAFDESLVGPKTACNHDCGLKATGFACGGPGNENEDRPPAMSLYCLHSSYEEPEIEEPAQCDMERWNQSVPILSQIKGAMSEQTKLYDVIIGLMVFVTFLLLSFIIYIGIFKGAPK